MKKLLFLGVIFAMTLFAGCGNNSKNEDNADSGEATSDIDTADTEQTDDSDSQPDDDPDEPSSGGGSCNGKKSFGSTSFTRDESNVFDDCLRELKYSNDSYCRFDPDILFAKLQKTTIVFGKKCKQNNEPVQCPDFIPDSITLSQITGCNIYYVYGEVDCYAECPDLYFSTDNEIFKVVSFHPYEGYISASISDLAYAYLSSVNAEKGLSFSIDTGENTATFKSPDSSITVPFQILVDGVVEIDGFQQCKDSEGRKYNEGDKISSECRAAYCSDGDWVEDDVTCYGCWGQEIGEIMKWVCADEVTEVDWCECIEDEEYGSKWSCIKRADLNCPEE